jgi:hypothetical protein
MSDCTRYFAGKSGYSIAFSSTGPDDPDKQPARVATVGAAIVLAGGAPSVLDGVALAAGNRILVKDQGGAGVPDVANGIYVVSILGGGANGTWIRSPDADVDPELFAGCMIEVNEGTVNADTLWVITTNDPINIGVTAILWQNFSTLSGWTRTAPVVHLTVSTDRVVVGAFAGDVATRKLIVANTAGELGIRTLALAAGDNVLEGIVTGEANARVQINHATFDMGPGGGVPLDVRIGRGAVDRWEMGGGDSFDAIAGGFWEERALTGDANPRMRLGSTSLSWGTGGAAVLDSTVQRGGVDLIEIAMGDTFRIVDGGWRTNDTAVGATPYAVLATDLVLRVAVAGTIDLPTLGGAGADRHLWVVRNAGVVGATTLDPSGAETINGLATLAMAAAQQAVHIYGPAGTTDWRVIA